MELVKGFLAYLSVEKGLSRNTTESYGRDLNSFDVFLKSKGWELNNFDRSDITDYLDSLREKQRSITSICRFISSLKGFSKYLLVEEIVDSDPTENLQSPKKWERLPKALSIDETM